MIKLNNYSKIQWACRRGMLELDLLLTPFVKDKYQQLTVEEQAILADLLTYPDPTLYAWLLGTERPQQIALAHLVEQIKDHAKSKI